VIAARHWGGSPSTANAGPPTTSHNERPIRPQPVTAEDLETIRQRPFAIKNLELVNLFLTEQHRRRTAGGDLEGMPSDLLPGRGVQECLQVTDRGSPHLCH
jgi:hypothetical protein